jgi:hypothetical protein
MFDQHETQNDTYFRTEGVDANKMSTRAYQKDRKGHTGPSGSGCSRHTKTKENYKVQANS